MAREVLSLVPGEPVLPNRTELYGTDEALAGIGRLVCELHDLLAGFVPMRPDARVTAGEQGRRLQVLVDAYGPGEAGRHRLLDQLARRPRAMYELLAGTGGRDGVASWSRLWREGHCDTWWAVTEHVTAHRHIWWRSLLG